MDKKGMRGNSHPYAEQEFNSMLTDAHVGHFDSLEVILLITAVFFIVLW